LRKRVFIHALMIISKIVETLNHLHYLEESIILFTESKSNYL